MFQDFMLKQMLKQSGAPEDQIEAIIAMVKKNPELFKQIAEEVQERVKDGKSQMEAVMEVMMNHKDELEKLK